MILISIEDREMNLPPVGGEIKIDLVDKNLQSTKITQKRHDKYSHIFLYGN